MSPPVDGLDHVELLVPDRERAREWYREVLGLRVVEEFRHWATAGGPLMLSADDGQSMVALFEEPAGTNDGPSSGYRRMAFRTDTDRFFEFLDRESSQAPVFDRDANPIERLDAVDHGQSYSTYFYDPFGNALEVTTYEYDEVGARLDETEDTRSHE